MWPASCYKCNTFSLPSDPTWPQVCIQQQPDTGVQLTLSWLKPGHRESTVQCQLKLWQMIVCNLRIGFRIAKKLPIHVCNSIFCQYKYITWKFSDGIYRDAIIYSTKKIDMSLYQTLISPLISERNTPQFTIMPYSCHRFLAVRTFVNTYFEGWSTVRVKFCQKSLMNTLKGLWELQPLSSNQTDALVSQLGLIPH